MARVTRATVGAEAASSIMFGCGSREDSVATGVDAAPSLPPAGVAPVIPPSDAADIAGSAGACVPTDGTGSVAACSLAQLRELDAGCGAAVPLLREVFELLGSTTGINVELKGAGTAPRLAALLGDYPNQDLLVSSFDHEALRVFHRARADVPVAPLFHRWQRNAWQIADTIGAWSINLSARTASGARIAKAHANGFRVLVYTVNKVGVANRLRAFGVDGVFTDYPDRITLACLNDPTPG